MENLNNTPDSVVAGESDSLNPVGRGKRYARNLNDYFRIVMCGFAMGIADVIPGVSGGTIAFLLGIYEELVNSIRLLSEPRHIKLLFTFKFGQFFEVIPWKFLTALLSGILIAVFSLAKLLKNLLENYPELVWSFFFGLILASIIIVTRKLKDWGIKIIFSIIIGAGMAYWIIGLAPAATPNQPWFLFLCGFIAICAMILPGISGSFILVILGKYSYIITAVTNFDLTTLAIVAFGCLVGIVSFARVLSWLFLRYHNGTIAILIGLMVGSLRKIWPWKITVKEMLDRHNNLVPMEQHNVLPYGNYLLAITLMMLGFLAVIIMDSVASGKTENPEPIS